MAVEITPLGFRAPDGKEPVRNGDNDIAANARKAQELIAEARTRLAYLEILAGAGSGTNNPEFQRTPLKVGYCQLDHTSALLAPSGADATFTIRREFTLPVTAERFRVHVRNRDFLHGADSGTTTNNALGFMPIYIGEHKIDTTIGDGPTGGFKSAPVDIDYKELFHGGEHWVTPWVTPDKHKIRARVPQLLSYSYMAPKGTVVAQGGGGQWYAFGAIAHQTGPEYFTWASSQSYLDVWVEYEARTTAPRVLVLSNSLSSPGTVNGTYNKGDSAAWPQQLAMATGALVSSIGVSGSWQNHYTDVAEGSTAKWNHYDNPDWAPDVVILFALQSSDLQGGSPIAGVKSKARALTNIIRSKYPAARIITTNIPPRVDFDATTDATRKEWNAHIATGPYGYEAVVDVDWPLRQGVSPDRLHPDVNGDGTHFNSLGHSRAAGTILQRLNQL